MNNPRIKILESYLAAEPSDPFNSYALALEYVKENSQKAELLFEQLLVNHPDYLPTYYSAASFHADKQNDSRAIEILKSGIELAEKLGESKTLRELKNALQNLEL